MALPRHRPVRVAPYAVCLISSGAMYAAIVWFSGMRMSRFARIESCSLAAIGEGSVILLTLPIHPYFNAYENTEGGAAEWRSRRRLMEPVEVVGVVLLLQDVMRDPEVADPHPPDPRRHPRTLKN